MKKTEGHASGSTPPPAAHVVRETLELVHHHPGRLRVRAEAFRADGEMGHRVREAALGVPGVKRFEHNARTGSILIEYEPGHAEPDVILAHLADAAGVDPCTEETLARTRTPALLAVGVVQELNAIMSELTGQRADLRSLVPAALSALSAYSFVTSKEHKLPRWDNLLWWSYSVFMNHHRGEIEASAEERRLERLERREREAARVPSDVARPARTET